MKVAIQTIQSINYGNRLQNYALQTILESFGCEVRSLRRDAGFNGSLRSKVLNARQKIGTFKHMNDRVGAFRLFDKKNITFSKEIVSKDYISSNLDAAFDCFVIGSDQVWNPTFAFNSQLEYLPMVSYPKKISYAASFGVNEIKENREETAALLNKISYISVRERAGANIVKNLTGRDVPVVLDPTLLLNVERWQKVAIKPQFVESSMPYIFKYVLGDDLHDAWITNFAENYGYRVINAMDESLAIGPSEFVWLIAHSSLVCTDSFHASVFALLHHKPLGIFERAGLTADMSSRFDTFCSVFGLEGHRSSEPSFSESSIFQTDWADVDARRAALSDYSLGWLRYALDGVARG